MISLLEQIYCGGFMKKEFRMFLILKSSVKKSIRIANALIKGEGRILVRKSGTEPKIRIMCESFNNSLIDKCINIIKKTII